MPLAARGACGTARISIGVRVVHCADLRVRSASSASSSRRRREHHGNRDLAHDECWNMRVRRNRFLHDDDYVRDGKLNRLLIGLAATEALPDQGRRAAGRRNRCPSPGDASMPATSSPASPWRCCARRVRPSAVREQLRARMRRAASISPIASQQRDPPVAARRSQARGDATAKPRWSPASCTRRRPLVLAALHEVANAQSAAGRPRANATRFRVGRAADATTSRTIRAHAKRINAQS